MSSAGVLGYRISWHAAPKARTAANATEGFLELSVRDHIVWSADAAFSWTWIELLEWLGQNWSCLELEDGLPFDVDPVTLVDLRNHVKRSSSALAHAVAEERELRLWDFLEAHDLNRSLQGANYSGVVVWREGLVGHVLTELFHETAPWDELRESLGSLGDEIAARLESLGVDDGRAQHALRAWRNRGRRSRERVLRIVTGLPNERLAEIQEALVTRDRAPSELSIEAPERNELLAAARMTAALPNGVIVDVLSELASLPKRTTADLDHMSSEVEAVLRENADGRPYEQGYAVARYVRERTLPGSRPISGWRWLESMNVEYRETRFRSRAIDAVACWGLRHGPAVVINTAGPHAATMGGRNASVAHEIGHLLMDRRGALPAAEVLGGRISPGVEARARAFAAEVLLPREAAGSALATAGSAEQAQRAVKSLTSRYIVSQELVAWQARNSDFPLSDDVFDYLRSLVRETWRF